MLSILTPFVPELTPQSLVTALKRHETDGHSPLSPMVDPQRAAALCGVSVFTIRRMIKDRRLAAKRIGRQWRIRESDLAELMGC